MIKTFLSLVFIFGLMSCKSPVESPNYLGQSYPDSIPVIFAPDVVSVQGRLEHGISFTPDTRELAFGILDQNDYRGEILYAKQVSEKWTEPAVFKPLKGESVYLPYFSPDGNTMLFSKSKADTNIFVTDIWTLSKSNDAWGQPKKVDSPISSSTREATACMTLDKTIYFSSNRGGAVTADLYSLSPNEGKYVNAERIEAVCSERDEESVFVSPDKRYMIFSRYATDENGPDLFISYQGAKGHWTQPKRSDTTINTADWERRPFVSMDNKFLFFTKLTIDQSGISESDIYWVNTRSVFKPYVFSPITKQVIKIGRETVLKIPLDYFKDIDHEKLAVSFNHETVGWAKFDEEEMTLTMNPSEVGEFDVVFTAIDKFSNETSDSVRIVVKK